MLARLLLGSWLTAACIVAPTSAASITSPSPAAQDPAPVTRPQQDPQKQPGHLVLILEGTAGALRVTHAVAKPSRWSGPQKGLESEFQFVAFDAAGRELRRLPIDLSDFETDPRKSDKPVVVNGCEVKTPQISVLFNAPRDGAAVRYELRRGDKVIGRLSGAQLQQLLGGGR